LDREEAQAQKADLDPWTLELPWSIHALRAPRSMKIPLQSLAASAGPTEVGIKISVCEPVLEYDPGAFFAPRIVA
jgi:hypothetical protein